MTTSEIIQTDSALIAHRVLRSAEAAAYCGYSVHRWRQLHREGRVPKGVRIAGGHLGFRLADLIAFNSKREG